MAFDKASYDNEYMKAFQRRFVIKANKIHDADIIEWMSSRDNKQGYIKELIRADMERQRNAT